MMTIFDQEFLAVQCALRDIAKELKTMNKLKALELKGKSGFDMNVSVDQVDYIMEDDDAYTTARSDVCGTVTSSGSSKG